MADLGVGEIAMLAIAAASAAYEVSQSGKTPNMPKPVDPNTPKAPVSSETDINAQNKIAQQQAETAAGTIFSPNQGEQGGRVTNDPLTPRKTLTGM